MRTNELVVAMMLLGLAGCPAESNTMGGTGAFTTAPPPGGDEGDDASEDDDANATESEEEDDGDPSASGPNDSGPSGEDGPQTTGDPSDDGAATSGPSGESSGGGAGSEGGGDPALMNCLDMAASDCEECACNNCLTQLMACQQDPGCVAIRMCAQQNMCTGIECLGPCGDVIDANGGAFGPSAGLASDLSDCYTGACPGC